ncbi:hypothetical protein [Amycolatopsis kentuckyensis]|uniref:hypothetical protein n=1 Tax=Amycolatopsis kentuckyensis TaxID=218823 RepID=UPI00356A0D6D
MNESVVISRTEGRHWILAGVLLLVAGGFVWLTLASQRRPGAAGWVFGGAFGLLGLILVSRSLPEPVVDELVLDVSGISRIVGGVVWAVR